MMDRDDREARHDARPQRKANFKLIVAIALVALLLLFGIVNGDKVEVDFLVTSKRAPLIVVIALSAVLGAMIGGLLACYMTATVVGILI